jgi:hypothetical protein
MILVLLGTIIGSLFGFKAQEIVPKTESFHIQNILNNGQLTLFQKLQHVLMIFGLLIQKKNNFTILFRYFNFR